MVREASLVHSRRKCFLVTRTCGRGSETAIRVWEGTIETGSFGWLEGLGLFLSLVGHS